MGETLPAAIEGERAAGREVDGALFTDGEVVRPANRLALDALREDAALTLRVDHADRRRHRARAATAGIGAGPLRGDEAASRVDRRPIRRRGCSSTNTDTLSF